MFSTSIARAIAILVVATMAASAAGQLSDRETLRKLKALPTLPKVHYSWPLMVNAPRISLDVATEYARITRAIGQSVQWASDSRRWAYSFGWDAVRLANERYPGTDCRVCLNYTPWFKKTNPAVPRDPTQFGQDIEREIVFLRGRLTRIKAWLAAYNQQHESNVRIGAILLDSESFGGKAGDDLHNVALDTRHNLIYLVCRTELGADVRIEWYGRRMVEKGNTASGWYLCPLLTGHELGGNYSVSLYRVYDPEVTHEEYRRTVAEADKAGVKHVTPWVALASGWRPGEKGTFRRWDRDYDFDVQFSWQIGYEIHHPPASVPYGRADVVVFYPAPFSNDAWIRHFVAYARGAHGERDIDDVRRP